MFLRRKISKLLPELKAYAIAICRDEDTAADLVQEACKKVLAAPTTPKSYEDLKPWMFRVIRNIHIDQKRREKTAAEYFDNVSRLYDGTPPPAPRVLEEILVRQALQSLTDQEREILYLIDVFGLKYAEAAIVLGLAEGTIMSRVSRARKSLLKQVNKTNVQPLDRKKSRK